MQLDDSLPNTKPTVKTPKTPSPGRLQLWPQHPQHPQVAGRWCWVPHCQRDGALGGAVWADSGARLSQALAATGGL